MEEKRGPYNDYFKQGYKRKALKIAKQLNHPIEVINKIEKAKNDEEIATIMYVAAKRIGD